MKALKPKIDRGDDFSEAVSYTEKLLRNPEHSYEALRKRSSAAACVQEWLTEIVKYIKSKQAVREQLNESKPISELQTGDDELREASATTPQKPQQEKQPIQEETKEPKIIDPSAERNAILEKLDKIAVTKASITELGALTNPSLIVKGVMQSVYYLCNGPSGSWSDVSKYFAKAKSNVREFGQDMKACQEKIEKGVSLRQEISLIEDFVQETDLEKVC